MSQHIENFNIAIRSLDVRTVEKFVSKSNGGISPIIIPETKKETAERFNYAISTFYDLDHYDDHRQVDNYDDELDRLRILAMSEIRFLTDEQIRRQLRHFESEFERFRVLVRTTSQFWMDYRAGTADTSLFMDLKIYPVFTNTNRPRASMDEPFVRNLKYAVRAKYGQLAAIIKDIKKELGIVENAPTEAATPESSAQNDELAFIYILPEHRERIFQSLKTRFVEEEKDSLRRLIVDHKPIEGRLTYRSTCISLCDHFKAAANKRDTETQKKVIADWLCQYFKVLDNEGSPVEMNTSTVNKYLKGQ